MLVRVDMPENPNDEARIVSEDGKVRMSASPMLVSKRLAKGEKRGYFEASIENGSLELGERKPNLGW